MMPSSFKTSNEAWQQQAMCFYLGGKKY